MEELTPIEILEKLDVFYNNAWNKLILFTTILLAVVGVVIPLIISWWQNRNLRLREEVLRKDLNDFFDSKISELKRELTTAVTKKFDQKMEEIKAYQDKIKSEMEGSHFHLQANTEDDPKEKIKSLVWAAFGYIDGDDFMNLNAVLEMISSNLPKIDQEDLAELEVEAANVDDLISELSAVNNKDSLTGHIRKLKLELGKSKKRKRKAT